MVLKYVGKIRPMSVSSVLFCISFVSSSIATLCCRASENVCGLCSTDGVKKLLICCACLPFLQHCSNSSSAHAHGCHGTVYSGLDLYRTSYRSRAVEPVIHI